MRATLFCLALAACSSTSSAPVPASPADSGATTDATSQDTWASYAAAFFTTYCVSCHNANDATGRDYNVQANVAKDTAVMRCGVAAAQDPSWNCAPTPPAKQFPIGSGPKPTDAERARIVAWITAGEP
jgi:mono/diheme cytochrome c family protein